jgi:hypothetical protein
MKGRRIQNSRGLFEMGSKRSRVCGFIVNAMCIFKNMICLHIEMRYGTQRTFKLPFIVGNILIDVIYKTSLFIDHYMS